MTSKFYSVKEVTERLDIEAYVLRFYEKELNLQIQRNAQGHRMYTEENIERFRQIKDLREQGLQLKAIENVIHNDDDIGEVVNHIATTTRNVIDITDRGNTRVKQFSEMMKDTFREALIEYNEESRVQLKKELSSDMNQIVDKKFTEYEMMQEQKNDEYYKKIDEAMREMQQMRKELAVKQVEVEKPKSSLWKKFFKEKDKSISME
ncbi:MAG: helix-turn-helix domain-containing protein [Cellulosilyticaceae bacterium]